MSAPTPNRKTLPLAITFLLMATALAAAGFVQAEVVDMKNPGPSEAGVAIHQEPVQLECWQNGRRIIQEDDLGGLAIKAVSQRGAVAFKPADGEGPEIFLLPFDDSLCLVAPDD